MSLTKTEIATRIQDYLGYSQKEAAEALETLLEIIKQTLENGEDVLISGFGKFCVKEKKKRKGRNPATHSEIVLPERRVATFRCSRKLRDRVNGD
jgi:integration host factor subunit alpha